MTLLNVIGAAAVLFFGTTIAAYGQNDGKDEPQRRAEQSQPHAQPARAPERAQQAQAPEARPPQHAQQAQAPEARPQQHGQQAPTPEARPQQRAQQTPTPAARPQQHGQQANAPSQQHARQAGPAAAQSRQRVQANLQQPPHTQQQVQSWQQQRGWASKGGAWQPHTNFQQGRDQNWASDHRSWTQRGGYGGFYIPQASFGLYFGSSHFFHIGIMPTMYMGYPRFAYGGFSFMLVDPWPGSWQENWYASDDLYIDYNGGYYLHDRRYPGVRLAITVAR